MVDRFTWDEDIKAEIGTHSDGYVHLAVHGHGWPICWKIPEGNDPDDVVRDYGINNLKEFLTEIAPFLAEPLTIQAIGAEKCRFRLSVAGWHIESGSREIEQTSFKCDIEKWT